MEHSSRSRRGEGRRRRGSRSRSRDGGRRRERRSDGGTQPATDAAPPVEWRGPGRSGPPPADWRGPNSNDVVPRDWRGPPQGMGMGMYPPARGDARWGMYPGDQTRGPMPPHYGAPMRPGMPPPWGHPPAAMQPPRPDEHYRNDPPADWRGAAMRPSAGPYAAAGQPTPGADMWGAPRPPPHGAHAPWPGAVPPPSSPLPAGGAHPTAPNPGAGEMDKPAMLMDGPAGNAATGPALQLTVDGAGGADGVAGALAALFAADSFGVDVGEGGVDFDEDTAATPPKDAAAERLQNIPIVGEALSQKTIAVLAELDVPVSNPVAEFNEYGRSGSSAGGGTSAMAEEVASVRAKCVRLGLEGVATMGESAAAAPRLPAPPFLPICTAPKQVTVWEELRLRCGSAVPVEVSSTTGPELRKSKLGNVLVPQVVA